MIDTTLLIDTIENLDLHVRSYSKKCVEFTTDSELYDSVVIALTLLTEGADDEDITALFKKARTDSLGRSTIVYFPCVEWPKDRQENDDEDE